MVTTPHPYKSERTDVLVAVEGDQKTEVVPERYPGLLKGNQELADPSIEWIEERVVGGDRNPYQHVEGPKSFEGGSWTVVPYDGWPIAYVLGAESVSAETPEAGLTEHVLTPKQDGPPPTLTVEGDYYAAAGDDFSRGLLGVAPESGTIEVNNEEELQVSITNTALGLTDDTYDDSRTPTTGVSLPDREVWSFRRTMSNLNIFGTSFARVEDFSLEVTNNPTAERYIEASEAPDGEPYEVLYGNAEYSLDLEIAITDDSIYQELINPTAGGFSMDIEFAKGGNGDETLRIQGSNLRMEEAPHDIADEGKISISPSITPRDVKVTVVDSQSAGTSYLEAGATA